MRLRAHGPQEGPSWQAHRIGGPWFPRAAPRGALDELGRGGRWRLEGQFCPSRSSASGSACLSSRCRAAPASSSFSSSSLSLNLSPGWPEDCGRWTPSRPGSSRGHVMVSVRISQERGGAEERGWGDRERGRVGKAQRSDLCVPGEDGGTALPLSQCAGHQGPPPAQPRHTASCPGDPEVDGERPIGTGRGLHVEGPQCTQLSLSFREPGQGAVWAPGVRDREQVVPPSSSESGSRCGG